MDSLRLLRLGGNGQGADDEDCVGAAVLPKEPIQPAGKDKECVRSYPDDVRIVLAPLLETCRWHSRLRCYVCRRGTLPLHVSLRSEAIYTLPVESCFGP